MSYEPPRGRRRHRRQAPAVLRSAGPYNLPFS